MYSRSRTPPHEEQYRSSLPPFYSGSRFQTVRREDTPASPPQPSVPAVSPAPAAPQEPPDRTEEEVRKPDPPRQDGLKIGDFSREDLLLLTILLLLCAEPERAMDVIVILLLLLGIR